MKSALSFIVVVLLFPGVMAAGSTKLVSTWKNPGARPDSFIGKKMASFLIDPDVIMREGPEETMAAELRRRGIECLAGYLVVPEKMVKDTDKAKELMKKMGITDAVLMRVIENEDRTSYVPGTVVYSRAYYQGFWSYWDYGWSAAYTPGYRQTDRVVSLEILLYSIEHDMLIWAGRSESTNPKDVRKLAKDLVDTIGKELRKAGLLQK